MPPRPGPTDTSRQVGDVTALLRQAKAGDEDALARLMPLVYRELKRQAAAQLRRDGRPVTLQPTALVHETYLRLAENRRIQWRDRSHFFAVSARLMRRILVDHARARHAQKRGDRATHVTLNDVSVASDRASSIVDVLWLDQTLDRLGALDPRLAQVVEMRLFAGLSVEETAHALDLSPRTIKSDWQAARAWLTRELRTPA